MPTGNYVFEPKQHAEQLTVLISAIQAITARPATSQGHRGAHGTRPGSLLRLIGHPLPLFFGSEKFLGRGSPRWLPHRHCFSVAAEPEYVFGADDVRQPSNKAVPASSRSLAFGILVDSASPLAGTDPFVLAKTEPVNISVGFSGSSDEMVKISSSTPSSPP